MMRYNPTVLRYQMSGEGEWNFGACKGMGFERVLIYPTNPILKYLHDGLLEKLSKGKTVEAFDIAKLYVAITRARFSVAFVCDTKTDEFIDGLKTWPDGEDFQDLFSNNRT